MPGLNRLEYNGEFWPKLILTVNDESILSWIESHLYLVTLEPRDMKYDVLDNIKIDTSSAEKLAFAAYKCWDAILSMDIEKFGKYFRESFEAQITMFPNMVDDFILKTIKKYKGDAFGWKLSGAGGGGYLILVSNKPVEGAIQIKIRRAVISD